MENLDKTLKRQLKRVGLDLKTFDSKYLALLQEVNATYVLHKREMELSNRAMSLSSNELFDKNEKLNHAIKLSNDFSHIVAHNLKEPIRTINSFSKLALERTNIEDAPLLQYLALIQEASSTMDIYLKDLMKFLLISSDVQGPKDKVKVDLNEVLERCFKNLSKLITDSNADFRYEALPVIEAYPSHIDQLFMNLISNAIKFKREENPIIKISAEKDSQNICLHVQDNGKGIRKEHHNRIFDVFLRLDRNVEGSGMGLAICKRIVEMYNGSLNVKSELGKGSRFTIQLPQTLVFS